MIVEKKFSLFLLIVFFVSVKNVENLESERRKGKENFFSWLYFEKAWSTLPIQVSVLLLFFFLVSKFRPFMCLIDPCLRLPLLLVIFSQFGQQLSGINAVFYYSNSIFTTAGLGKSISQYATIGTGLGNVFMALISASLMSRIGRRPLFLSSCYFSACCLLVLCLSILFTVSF